MDCDSFPGMSLISGLVYMGGYMVRYLFFILGYLSDGRKRWGRREGAPDIADCG
tara:strand:- start:29 stop:190 length:162 start_codon:yes stop_codon:yes gene_type:complete